jgi:hypothetical protein
MEFEKQAPHTVTCSKCLRPKALQEKTTAEFHTPITMFSVAVEDLDEIHRLQRECPAARISDDPDHEDYGIPIAPTRQAKKQILAATGYHEMNGFGTT